MLLNLLRFEIYERDNGLCGLCGRFIEWSQMHIDHIVPRFEGGADHRDNLRATHARCNIRRPKSPEVAAMISRGVRRTIAARGILS